MKKVLLTGAYKWTDERIKAVQNLGYETAFVQDERIPLTLDCGEFDAIVCNGIFLYNDIKKFTKLKFIQATSAGLDRIPLEYVNENGIKLYNARGVYSAPMAEWAIMRTLEIYKKSSAFLAAQLENKWEKQRNLFELSEKTVCIIGTGSVGTEVAKRFCAFDTKVIGADIFVNTNKLYDECVLIENLDEALAKSNIVVLTLPLTDKTAGMFGKDKFDKMKEGSVIINIARGGIVDEDAMVSALNNGKLMGAGLDVFENEPLALDSPLWNMKNVLISPHNSYASDKTAERLLQVILTNLKAFSEEE